MDIKTISEKAKEEFEARTGIKPLSASNRAKGSMKPWIRLVLPIAHDKVFEDRYIKHNMFIGDFEVDFIHSDFKHPERVLVEIQKYYFNFFKQ